MSDTKKFGPSFSIARRWRIGFDILLRTVLVVAVVVMANYLTAKFSQRFYLSSQTRVALSSGTLAVLKSVTNQVDVTLYYNTRPDDSDPNFYEDILALLHEYQAANRNIVVHTVDYVRDPGLAEITKAKYRQYFNTESDKDMVIFDDNGRVQTYPGALLIEYKTVPKGSHKDEKAPSGLTLDFERRPVNFNAEQKFTSILLALANPQPLKACFLQGHGEPSLTSSGDLDYQKFASVLQQNYISVTNLDWAGNAGVPADCNLLIIAGPKIPLMASELQQISQYLREGGKLFVMFSYASVGKPTGLEGILQNWGVGVVDDVALDPDHTVSARDVVVDTFGKHPAVDSISQLELQLFLPRPIVKLPQSSQVANVPEVTSLFGTSGSGVLMNNRAEPPQHIPLAAAIEQKPVAGVNNPRGNTRIIAVGDYIFLGNHYIDSGGNREFLDSTINWLCERPFLLNGIGPRPVTNFQLLVTPYQKRQLNWLLLGALPGGVLLLGSIVWFVRRK